MQDIKVQAWFGLLGLGILIGLLTVYKVFTVGFIVYAKTDILVWTLPVAAYIFFSLTSTGLAFVSSIPVVFGIRRYQPIEQRTALLEIAVMLAGFTCLLLHLGSPWNAIYFTLSPNFTSPLWWLALLYPNGAKKFYRIILNKRQIGLQRIVGTNLQSPIGRVIKCKSDHRNTAGIRFLPKFS